MKKIKDYLRKTFGIKAGKKLYSSGAIDSFDIMHVKRFLEATYKVKIPTYMNRDFESPESMLELVKRSQ